MEVDALGDEVGEESEPVAAVAHPGHRSRSTLGEIGDFPATCSFFFQFSLDFGGEFWTVMICWTLMGLFYFGRIFFMGL